jgi:hypothetical protein
MRLENRHHTQLLPLLGAGGALLAVALLVGSTGPNLVSAGMLLLVSWYFLRHQYIESVVVQAPYLIIHSTKLFRTSTQRAPLTDITTTYQVVSGLRSSPHYVLTIYYQQRKIASLSPKEGFTSTQLDALAAYLAAAAGRLPT